MTLIFYEAYSGIQDGTHKPHQENNTSLEMLELAPLAFLAESSSPALELALT